MKKIKNNKGFTLIEILIVVVILGLLASLAFPIISGTINLTRKKTLVSITSTVIDSVKDDILANDYGPGYVYYLNTGCYNKYTYEKLDITDRKTCLKSDGIWHQFGINDLLDKDMINSPFGDKFSEESYVEVTDKDGDGNYEYNVCITDGINGIYGSSDNLNDSFGEITSCTPEDDKFNIIELDESGANKPVLTSNNNTTSNLIAVYYDQGNNVWRKADSKNQKVHYEWYNYDAKKWANAVTVTEESRNEYVSASLGTEIKMEDINTMWVWIPRFSASGDIITYNGGTKSSPGAFNIEFKKTNETAHEAFTFGTKSLDGFWVGKFENSSNIRCTPKGAEGIASSALGEDCNRTDIKPLIIPNVTSWRGAMVSTYFYSILNMTSSGNIYGFDTSYDTHMMKNSEWGAVAYFTQSIYGRCSSSTSCSDMGINNYNDKTIPENKSYEKYYKTGYGSPAGSSSNSSQTSSYVDAKSYDTSQGMDASTTGNIYGVYEMSGGAEEYVMGIYSKRVSGCDVNSYEKWSGLSLTDNIHSGFYGCLNSSCSSKLQTGVSYPNSKYYDVYSQKYSGCNPISNNTLDYSNDKQHALTETGGWYQDQNPDVFISTSTPWFVRGGRHALEYASGIFGYHTNYGNGTIYYGSRSVLVK